MESEKVLPREENKDKHQKMKSEDQSEKDLQRKDSKDERQKMKSDGQSENDLPREKSDERQKMKSEDQSEKDLSRKKSDGEQQRMKSEDQTEKDLSRKESNDEHQKMKSENQSEKDLSRKKSDGEQQRMKSEDQSEKDLSRKESHVERQRMELDDQSEKDLQRNESKDEQQKMKSKDQPENDLSRKESDGECQKMKSEDQSEKDLQRKGSNNERQKMKSDDQSEKDLPRKESDGEQQRMKSDNQSEKIFVKVTKTIAVDVTNTDTIDAIKTKVQEIEGIVTLSKQSLFFGQTRLEGTQTLDYYNIPTNSCIDLDIKDGITISIKALTFSFSLDVKTSDTISNIKAMIHDKVRFTSDQQISLIFSGKMLDEDQTLASCGVHDNAVLQMLTRPSTTLHVTVNLIQGSAIKLEVQNWYTIAELKNIIGLDDGLRLFHYESGPELHNEKTLRQYMINDGDVLKVKTSVMRIFVMFRDEANVTMIVDAYEKLSDVVVRIGEMLNLNPELFTIQLKRRDLNSNSTVRESGVGDDSTLEVVPLKTHRRYWGSGF